MIKRPLHLSHDFLAEVLDEEQALQSTKERLEKQEIHNAHLILDGHQHIDHYVNQPIRAAIFNLGYLPSADKTVITKPDTTLIAVEKILEKLEVGGRLAIMIYYGHEGGDMEKDAVLEYVNQLDQRLFTAMLYQPLNQINQPPFLVMIEKLKQSKES